MMPEKSAFKAQFRLNKQIISKRLNKLTGLLPSLLHSQAVTELISKPNRRKPKEKKIYRLGRNIRNHVREHSECFRHALRARKGQKHSTFFSVRANPFQSVLEQGIMRENNFIWAFQHIHCEGWEKQEPNQHTGPRASALLLILQVLSSSPI